MLTQEQKSSGTMRMTLITTVLIFLLIISFIIAIVFYRNRIHKSILQSNIEALIYLREYSAKILNEKDVLQNSVNEKEALIESLDKRIKEDFNQIKLLNENISKKDVIVCHLQNLLQNKESEVEDIQETLDEKDYQFERLKEILCEKSKQEITQAEIIETLFKEKWITLDMLCNQYFCLNNAELSEKSLLSNIEREIKRIVSKNGLAEIVDSVDQHMSGIITELRRQCPFFKEDDINYIALSYAGFSARSICLFTGIKYKYYYVKKARLIERLRKSYAPKKDLFISKIK